MSNDLINSQNLSFISDLSDEELDNIHGGAVVYDVNINGQIFPLTVQDGEGVVVSSNSTSLDGKVTNTRQIQIRRLSKQETESFTSNILGLF